MPFTFQLTVIFYVWLTGGVTVAPTRAENIYTDSAYYRIMSDLFSQDTTGILPHTLPVFNSSQPVQVFVGLSLTQLVALDERNQHLTINFWTYLYWTNPFLTWDPADYNDTDIIYLPAKYIWVPRIFVANDIYREKIDDSIEDVFVALRHDGFTSFYYPARLDLGCRMVFTDYPFDEQSCNFVFTTWSVQNSEIQFLQSAEPLAPSFEYEFFQKDSGWGLVYFSSRMVRNFYTCCVRPFDEIEFSLVIRRRSILQVCYLLIPNMLINITAFMSFLLPCDTTERCSLGITIYLSMVVYLLLIQGLIPNSETVPWLVVYINSTLILVGASQVLTILVLSIHFRGNHDNEYKVPSWVRKYVMHNLANVLGMSKLMVSDSEHERKLQAKKTISVEGRALIDDSPAPPEYDSPVHAPAGLLDPNFMVAGNESSVLMGSIRSKNSTLSGPASSLQVRPSVKLKSSSNRFSRHYKSPVRGSFDKHGNRIHKKNAKKNAVVPKTIREESPTRVTPVDKKTIKEESATKVAKVTHPVDKKVADVKKVPDTKKVAPCPSEDQPKVKDSVESKETVSESEVRQRKNDATDAKKTVTAKKESVGISGTNWLTPDAQSPPISASPSKNASPFSSPRRLSVSPTLQGTEDILSKMDEIMKSSGENLSPGSHPKANLMHDGIVLDVDDLKQNDELLLYKLLRLDELRTYLSLDQEHKHEIQCEWQQLAMLIDRFMFFLFVFMTAIVWIVYFANIPTYSRDIII